MNGDEEEWEHEESCDHDEQPQMVVVEELPCWRFSWWDVLGIGVSGVGGLFSVVGQTSAIMAREFMAAANYSRRERDYAEAEAAQAAHAEQQRAIARDLERLMERSVDDS